MGSNGIRQLIKLSSVTSAKYGQWSEGETQIKSELSLQSLVMVMYESFRNNTGFVLLFVYTTHTEASPRIRGDIKRHQKGIDIHGIMQRGGTGAIG
jgi:hypothetical protein